MKSGDSHQCKTSVLCAWGSMGEESWERARLILVSGINGAMS